MELEGMAAALNPNAPAYFPFQYSQPLLPYSPPPPPPPPPSNCFCFALWNQFQRCTLYYAPPPPPLPPDYLQYSSQFPVPPAPVLPPQPVQEATPAPSAERAVVSYEPVPPENSREEFQYHNQAARTVVSPPSVQHNRRKKGFRRVARTGGRIIASRRKISRVGFQIGNDLQINGGAASDHTTVMIRNLPNKFTKETLLGVLGQHCMEENQKPKEHLDEDRLAGGESCRSSRASLAMATSEFDFLYLPVDFKSGSNLGYAFVNFTNAVAARRLHGYLHNYSWKAHGSSKVCQITYARIQGLEALIEHFRNSVFVCDSDNFLPVCFNPARDGRRPSEESYIGHRYPAACTNTP